MINPFLIILILLGVVLLWFLLAFIFNPIGKIAGRIIGDAIKAINEEEMEEKENE